MNDRRNQPQRPDRSQTNPSDSRDTRPQNIRSVRGNRYDRPARTQYDQDNEYSQNNNKGYERPDRAENKEVIVENPYVNFKYINKEDIDVNFVIPKIPEQPKLSTPEDKEKKQGILDEEIRKLENQKSGIIAQINDFRRKIKKNKKPDEIYQAEQRKMKLIDSKKKL